MLLADVSAGVRTRNAPVACSRTTLEPSWRHGRCESHSAPPACPAPVCRPLQMLLPSFLSPEEVDHMIRISRDNLERSEVRGLATTSGPVCACVCARGGREGQPMATIGVPAAWTCWSIGPRGLPPPVHLLSKAATLITALAPARRQLLPSTLLLMLPCAACCWVPTGLFTPLSPLPPSFYTAPAAQVLVAEGEESVHDIRTSFGFWPETDDVIARITVGGWGGPARPAGLWDGVNPRSLAAEPVPAQARNPT